MRGRGRGSKDGRRSRRGEEEMDSKEVKRHKREIRDEENWWGGERV